MQTLKVGDIRSQLSEVDQDAEVVFMGGGEAAWEFYRVKGRGEKVVQIELREPDPEQCNLEEPVHRTTAGELSDSLGGYDNDCEVVFMDGVMLRETSNAIVFNLKHVSRSPSIPRSSGRRPFGDRASST